MAILTLVPCHFRPPRLRSGRWMPRHCRCSRRPTICFLCFGEKLIQSFAKQGDLSKHFKRKHLANVYKDFLGSA